MARSTRAISPTRSSTDGAFWSVVIGSPGPGGRDTSAGRCVYPRPHRIRTNAARACRSDPGVRASHTHEEARWHRSRPVSITTDIPARLDRLQTRRAGRALHSSSSVSARSGPRRALQVTIVGSMSEALKPSGTGLGMSSSRRGLRRRGVRRRRVLGCAGVRPRLTDRFRPQDGSCVSERPDRSPASEVAVRRDQLRDRRADPARYRGRIDIAIEGSFWVGAAAGSLLTIPLLDPTVVDAGLGWRLAFGLGAVLAVDPGAVHRVLLRDRYGGRRDQRAPAVRRPDRPRFRRPRHHRHHRRRA